MTTQQDNQDNGIIFNHQATAYGYLGRARKVTPKKGQDYLAVDFTALEGIVKNPDDKAEWDDLNKTYYSARVSGKGAQDLIAEHSSRINDRETTVTARVRMGISGVDIFQFKNGSMAGETGYSIRSRLLYVSYLKVGDTVIDLESYNGKPEDEGETVEDDQPSEATATEASDTETPANEQPATATGEQSTQAELAA